MIALRIYDTGRVYVILINPANPPEWYARWMESERQ
jgi:hypothetical protein